MSFAEKARAEREGLEAEAASLKQKLVEIDSAIAEIDSFLRRLERYADPEPAENEKPSQPSTDASFKRSEKFKQASKRVATYLDLNSPQEHPLYGRGLPGASALVLHKTQVPMTVSEITQYLIARGVQFAAKKPDSSVGWALSRAAEQSLVNKVGKSKWAPSYGQAASAIRKELLTIPPEAWEPKEPVKTVDNLAENDRSGRTRAGLALAKERGVRLGPPPRLTEEHRLLAIRMFKEGRTQKEMAAACNVSESGLWNRIKSWRAEGLFPERDDRPPQDNSPKVNSPAGPAVH